MNEQAPKSRRTLLSNEERACITDSYEPNVRVKSLPTIERIPSQAKTLICNNCCKHLRAEWFFVHPKSKASFVLVLGNGHAACRRTSSAIDCQFISADGSKTKRHVF